MFTAFLMLLMEISQDQCIPIVVVLKNIENIKMTSLIASRYAMAI